MSAFVLQSQEMPRREPVINADDSSDSDCAIIEAPRLGVPLTRKEQRGAAVERDPIFGLHWSKRKDAVLDVQKHSTKQHRQVLQNSKNAGGRHVQLRCSTVLEKGEVKGSCKGEGWCLL